MNDAQQHQSPFLLENEAAYQAWRNWKLAHQLSARELAAPVMINDPAALSRAEVDAIRTRCLATNWVLFRLTEPEALDEDGLKTMALQLGLARLDANLKSEESGISAIRVKKQEGKPYIPYTNHQLSWHTDGYYNDVSEQIHGWLLYCVSQAAEGGANDLLDHELLYMRLRDESPGMIDALMHPEAMTIPANVEKDIEIRPDSTGPVFSIDAGGSLHMRYSARTRNICWRDDDMTQAAAKRITELLADPSSGVIHYRLHRGEGLISNNILHRRDAFEDGQEAATQRLIYRARFYDRVANTDYFNEITTHASA